ncbi:MAG: CopD family protein [Devosia sp.]|uniref:CopD family protein n=1 Tax=Devosia sp. TaxID=1871048 RepID=UPI001AC2CC71|nr:CopD family protein [Devosia sp.]MBN9318018.1 CopD family protein [Devosia sp.]
MDVASTLVLARWGYFLSVMILFGSTLFPFYALNRSGTASRAQQPRGINLALALATIAFAGVWLVSFAAGLTDREGTLEALSGVLLETGFGPVWIARISLVILLLGASLWGPPGFVPAITFLILTCEGWQGHAAVWGIVGSLSQAVHVAAAAAWIGGLVPLGRLIVAARRDPTATAEVVTALGRFSSMGVAAVALIAVTGALNTWQMLGGVPDPGDAYGRVLLIKISLFAAMVCLALHNRYFLLEKRMKVAPAQGLRTLSRNVLLEQILGFAVLLDVSALGLMAPNM